MFDKDADARLVDYGLAVDYHPVVELDSGLTWGFEALIRSHHSMLGSVLPSELIDVLCGTRVPSGMRHNRCQEIEVGHLPAQQLITQAVAELQGQLELGLHRDRRPTDPRVEVRRERGEERGVV